MITNPEALATAAVNLGAVGMAMSADNAAVAIPTTAVPPAAADPVSLLTALAFSMHGDSYQAAATQRALIHQELVNTLGMSSAVYAVTEAASTAAL